MKVIYLQLVKNFKLYSIYQLLELFVSVTKEDIKGLVKK